MKQYMTIICLTSWFLLTLMSCHADKKRGNDKQSMRSEVETGSEGLRSGEVTYTADGGWIKQQPSSPMRKDQFSLPGVSGAEAAELAVFFFPGGGGTVDANLKRWYDQFKQPDGSTTGNRAELEKLKVNTLSVTTVYVTGTYLKSRSLMMMGGPVDELSDYALLAAIAETAEGSWFFKATGPQQTIDHWRARFGAFVQSFRVK